MYLFLTLGILVAAVSAGRGVWSPCGLSMLSSITPMTEAGRGNRFSVTARWFLAGGIVGGLCLGAVAAGAASLLALADLSTTVRWGIGAAAAIVTAGIDLGAFGIELPIFKRQVNDAWLRTYRSRVYGAGFGWQIGFGVATYIMTAGVFLTIALAILGASPLVAVAIGATFGLVRGSAVYIGRNATSPAALNRVHERLDALAPASRRLALTVQLLAAVVLSGSAFGPAAGLVVGLASVGALVVSGRSQPSRAATA
ncbi:hypothetical protein [Aquihabitans sp. McL0605]|uniref:hypothetical protein n=1 Tax=Aquihabitans sp. McL0605 TaxID=3415671 RepID=UPI003CE73AE6